MEYLPTDPNEDVNLYAKKKKNKIKEFRKYLSEKGVVLSIVKCMS